MSIYIKNESNETQTYLGTPIQAGTYYSVPKILQVSWSSNSEVLADIANQTLVVATSNDELNDITDVSRALNHLMGTSVQVETLPASYAFAKKVTEDGKKLKRRKHGIRKSCLGNTETPIELIVPYGHCKIDEVEIVQCSGNDNVDLMVYDTEVGTYSGIPNYMLDQFGFDIAVSDMYYSDSSNYDADLYGGMKVVVVFKNNEAETKNIGINFVLHEVI